MLKGLCLTIIFLLSLQLLCGQPSEVVWSKDRPLTFQDFQGAPDDSVSAAVTYCGIEYKVCKVSFWTGKVVIAVQATFDQQKSWFLQNKLYDYILRHEQTHFDLAEWYARKLRQMIAKSTILVNRDRNKLESMVAQINIEYLTMQKEFDRETEFGNIRDKELEWEALIAQGITELDEFAKSICDN